MTAHAHRLRAWSMEVLQMPMLANLTRESGNGYVYLHTSAHEENGQAGGGGHCCISTRQQSSAVTAHPPVSSQSSWRLLIPN